MRGKYINKVILSCTQVDEIITCAMWITDLLKRSVISFNLYKELYKDLSIHQKNLLRYERKKNQKDHTTFKESKEL